jgi:hypothetical protein
MGVHEVTINWPPEVHMPEEVEEYLQSRELNSTHWCMPVMHADAALERCGKMLSGFKERICHEIETRKASGEAYRKMREADDDTRHHLVVELNNMTHHRDLLLGVLRIAYSDWVASGSNDETNIDFHEWLGGHVFRATREERSDGLV